MESKPEENNSTQLDPIQEVADALAAMNIDYKSPDFKIEDAQAKLLELSQNPGASHMDKQQFTKLHKIISEHKFWAQQAINHPMKQVHKEGLIEKIDTKAYQ